ncbi:MULTISPECIES: fumarylacetoacetate hydrolase family protein [unclassified Nocardioides]|uniref:fumarylacetoacetate hydrolase family protein n=1 Tax=unclassified Nocardioides TaxID=2615069 RepID=UPI00360DC8E6
MQVVRVRPRDGEEARAAVRTERGVHPLGMDVHELLRFDSSGFRTAVEAAAAADPVGDELDLCAPIAGRTEVWAAGVTYERSRVARVQESERDADVYDRVYDAERPELFFKAAAWRVSGDGAPVSVREDSEVNVPEPELAVVANCRGEVVGWTICNDVSSRSIEGENPLYLPQAKAYLGACSLGPGITPVWEVPDPRAIGIRMTITRAGAVVWDGESTTSELRRDPEELLAYLHRADEFPEGVVLATGTSLVPELPFTLRADDVVSIELAGLGVLANPVVVGKAAVSTLQPAGAR